MALASPRSDPAPSAACAWESPGTALVTALMIGPAAPSALGNPAVAGADEVDGVVAVDDCDLLHALPYSRARERSSVATDFELMRPPE